MKIIKEDWNDSPQEYEYLFGLLEDFPKNVKSITSDLWNMKDEDVKKSELKSVVNQIQDKLDEIKVALEKVRG